MVKRVAGTGTKENAPKDPYVFRYLKFQCEDVKKTQDFYLQIGMSVDWQVKQGLKSDAPPPAAGQVLPTASTQPPVIPSNSSKPPLAPIGAKPELKEEDYLIVFAMSFRSTSTHEKEIHRVQIVFEHLVSALKMEDDDAPKEEEDEAEKHKAVLQTQKPLSPSEALLKPRNAEYLLIYVRFVTRIVKRLATKGYNIVLPATELQEQMKIAILKDPNGIEVRLVEQTDLQFDDVQVTHDKPSHVKDAANAVTAKRNWVARIGFYSIPTMTAHETVKLYEKQLAVQPPPPPQKKNVLSDISATAGAVMRSKPVKAAGKKGKEAEAVVNLQGFHKVDSEDFVLGLMKTEYFWLGNEERTKGCSVCFSQITKADTKKVMPINREGTKLLAIGFDVPNLDIVTKKWDSERLNEITGDTARYRLAGIGQCARYKEHLNNLHLEFFMHKTIDPAEQQKALEALAAAAAEKERAQKEKAKQDASNYKDLEIDPNYLGGLKRYKSAGAIRVKPPEKANKPDDPSKAWNQEAGKDGAVGEDGKKKTIKFKMQKLKDDDEGGHGVTHVRNKDYAKGLSSKLQKLPNLGKDKSGSMMW